MALLAPIEGAADGWRGAMLDVAMVVVGCAFLVAAVLYTLGCDRL